MKIWPLMYFNMIEQQQNQKTQHFMSSHLSSDQERGFYDHQWSTKHSFGTFAIEKEMACTGKPRGRNDLQCLGYFKTFIHFSWATRRRESLDGTWMPRRWWLSEVRGGKRFEDGKKKRQAGHWRLLLIADKMNRLGESISSRVDNKVNWWNPGPIGKAPIVFNRARISPKIFKCVAVDNGKPAKQLKKVEITQSDNILLK